MNDRNIRKTDTKHRAEKKKLYIILMSNRNFRENVSTILYSR